MEADETPAPKGNGNEPGHRIGSILARILILIAPVIAPVPSTTPDHVQAENLEGGSASGSTNSIVESSIIITENVENSVCMQDKETERNAAASSADAGPVNFSSSVVETCETSKNTAEKENDGNGEVNENFVKIDEEQQQQQQEEICSADLVEETLAVDSEEDKPPIPLPTYRWEDIKKAKEQGGYPWTHLYKRKLDATDDETVFATFPKKSTSKIQKKVRIQENTQLVTGSANDIDQIEKMETTFEGAEEPAPPASPEPDARKSPKSILKRSYSEPSESTPEPSSSKNPKFVDRLKTMAGKQLEKLEKAKQQIKRIPLKGKEKIVLQDKQKILKLKRSPKTKKHDFVSYIEKQDSDDTIDIANLDESPSEARKRRDETIPQPDEIIPIENGAKPNGDYEPIEINAQNLDIDSMDLPSEKEKFDRSNIIEDISREVAKEPEVPEEIVEEPRKEISEKAVEEEIKKEILEKAVEEEVKKEILEQALEEEIKKETLEKLKVAVEELEVKEPQLQVTPQVTIDEPDDLISPSKLHVYEDIEVQIDPFIVNVLGNESLKESLKVQDARALKELKQKSEESEDDSFLSNEVKPQAFLVPISSIDSTSSDDEPVRRSTLPALVEESDYGLSDIEERTEDSKTPGSPRSPDFPRSPEPPLFMASPEPTLEPAEILAELKKIAAESPELHVEPQVADALREEEEAPIKENVNLQVENPVSRWSAVSDHEYEPIEPPPEERKTGDLSPDVQMSAQEFQLHLEDQFFSAPPPSVSFASPPAVQKEITPLPDEEPKEKKSFLKSAQETSRSWQRKFSNQISNQAGNIKTKFGTFKKSKSTGDELEPEEEVRQEEVVVEKVEETEPAEKKKLDFSKFKVNLPEMPKMKKPNLSKFTSFDKPSLPEMPKINISETISKIKIRRSKSVKEEVEVKEEIEVVETVPEEKKKKFDFDTFRTYPRMLKNKLKKQKSPDQADSESGKFTEFNQEIDVEVKPVARKKPPRPELPQPESFESKDDSRDESKDFSIKDPEFDFNQNEVEKFPFARQDTQSLQSSDRQGVLEQIDDDQFFLRKKGISEDNIQIGDYISSAIREGLMDPVNALAQMVSDNYELDEEEIRYLQELQKEHPELNLDLDDAAFTPSKPRRSKKASSEDIQSDQVVPFDEHVWGQFKDIDDGSGSVEIRGDFNRFVPPTPPKRRKKRSVTAVTAKPPSGFEAGPKYIREDIQRAPRLARAEEDFSAPIPPIRRSRSRSRSMMTEDDRTSRGAESRILGSTEFEAAFKQEIPGYAVVRKDPPPRPPAPIRRNRSTKSLTDNDRQVPMRPHRNYSTIVPNRPPRKRSESREAVKDDVSDYEPIGDGVSQESETAKKFNTMDVVSKMKDRPLPAPPRPPRDKKSREKTPKLPDKPDPEEPKTNDDNDPKDDFDGGAVKTIIVQSSIESDPARLQTGSSFESGGRSLHAVDSFDSQYSYRVDESDASVQTDPLPDDFQLEDLEVTDDMRTITPTKFRTGFEGFEFSSVRVESRPETPSIEQELQRIQNRNGSQPSSRPQSRPSSRVSVKSRNSSRGSRPTTPALVFVERKISTPLIDGEQLEASLTVQPVEIDDETGDVIIVSSETPLDRIREIQEALDQRFLEELEKEATVPEAPKEEVHEEVKKVDVVPIQAEPVSAPISVPAPLSEPEPPARRRSRDTEQTPPRPPKPSPPRVAPAVPPLPTEPIVVPTEPTVIEEAPPVAPPRGQPVTQQQQQQVTLPETLHVSTLEVDRLSVHSLDASRITVSELEGGAIRAQDIDSPSVRNIQIPPNLIEEIVEQVARRTMRHPPPPPSTTPVDGQITPRQVVEEFSIPPASFYRLTNPPTPPTTQKSPAPAAPAQEASIGQLTGQLASACGSALSRQGRSLMNYLQSASKDENRRDVHVVLFILIVIIAGLFMIGMDHTDRTVHHHHWDYFNPPGNSGRPN